MEGSGLQGLVFRGVVKKRIVRVDWRAWDLPAREPERLPAGGEPENYILGRKHDEVLSEAIGPIWEIVVESAAEVDSRDLIRTPSGQIVVSERAREWLDLHAEGCLRFDRV